MKLTAQAGTQDSASRLTKPVIGSPIDVISPAEAVTRIDLWARAHQSKVVCICNVHSVVTARSDPKFAQAIAHADMATPDGAPVAWMLRRQGASTQQRVSGPDLMLDYMAHAAQTGQPVYLLGSTNNTLAALQANLQARWPGLIIAGATSPPFRPLTTEEDQALVNAIHQSKAGTVWVSLGCPKQELWMAAHKGRINAVMIGVGAAFDFHAGTVQRAPAWMRNNGLEWLHRLMSEPRRLWRRYLVTNTLFILAATRQLIRSSQD